MPKPRVYVTRQLFPEAIKILKQQADVEVFEGVDNPVPREFLLVKIRDADGLLSLLTDKIDAEALSQAPKLRVVANYAVGYNNIDVAEATRRGIRVTNTPGILTETTADLAFALLMASARRVAESDRAIRAGKWIHAWGPSMYIGQDVHEKTLGIVGLGRIGEAMAQRARGFNMRVLYYSHQRKIEAEKKLGIIYAPLEELLSESDYVSLHVPLTPETTHMISTKQLNLMKPTAHLINTSRGPVVDEKALAEALKTKRIAGAGIDVFEQEPLSSSSPLTKLENVVLTAHIASASIETRTRMAVMAATNLVAVLRGEEPPNLVNEEVKKVKPLAGQ